MNALLAPMLLVAALRATAVADASSVEVGEEIEIEIAVSGGALSAAAVTPPRDVPPGLELGPAQGPKLDRHLEDGPGGARQVERLLWYFVAVPTRPGAFTIPSFTVTAGGETARTAPIRFRATGSFEADAYVFVETRLDRRPRYVGEPVEVSLVAGVAHAWRERLLHGETALDAPWMRDGLAPGAPPEPENDATGVDATMAMRTASGGTLAMVPGEETRGGRRFVTWTATRRFVPSRAGTLEVPSSHFRAVIATEIEKEHPLSDRMFATATRLASVRSPSIPVEVRPLPERGRPDAFSGLVGRFTMDVEAAPARVRVGESIRVRVRVTGHGNVATVSLPSTEVDGFKRFGVEEEVSASGERILVYDLAPTSQRIREIPPFRIPYFDTTEGRYRELVSRPIPIEVAAGAAVSTLKAPAPPASDAPGKRDGPADARSAGRFAMGKPGWIALAAAFLAPPLLLGGWMMVRRRAGRAPPEARPPARPYARDAARGFRESTAALPQDERQAAAILAAAFARFLADVAGSAPEAFRGVDLAEALEPFVADRSVRERAARWMDAVERVAFGGEGSRFRSLREEAQRLAEAIRDAVR